VARLLLRRAAAAAAPPPFFFFFFFFFFFLAAAPLSPADMVHDANDEIIDGYLTDTSA